MIELLPYWHFDKDLMVFSDGSLGSGFKISGFDLTCKSDEEINQFSKNLESFLKSLVPTTRLQLLHKISPKVDDILNAHKNITELDDSAPGQVSAHRIDFLEEKAADKKYFSSEIYLFLRGEPVTSQKQGFFSKPEKFVSMVNGQYKSHRNLFLKSQDQIKSSLLGLGFSLFSLDKKQWTDLLYEYFNLEKSEKIGTPKLRSEHDLFSDSLSEQLVQTDFSINYDGLRQGDYYFKTISLKTLPDGLTYSGMIESLTRLPYHYWVFQNIHPLDQMAEKSKLSLKRRIAHSMSSGSQNLSDIESETKFVSLDDLLRELTEGSEKLISFDLNIVIWDKELKRLGRGGQEVYHFRRFGGDRCTKKVGFVMHHLQQKNRRPRPQHFFA